MRATREKKITPSSGNVFTDLGFDEAEAQVLALRADLVAQLEKQIKARKMTQVKAAKLLGVSQSRVSDLTRGKVEKFSLDTLVQFAARLGKPAKIELACRAEHARLTELAPTTGLRRPLRMP